VKTLPETNSHPGGTPNTHCFATPDEVSHLLGKSKSWLAKMRMSGDGPPYVKVGRSVLYELGELNTWILNRRRTSTSTCEPQ
jgi:predicted DNA-binding transcriptional regulator AlpA